MKGIRWMIAMKLAEWAGRLATDELKGEITPKTLRAIADRMEDEVDTTVNEDDGEVTVTATVDTNE